MDMCIQPSPRRAELEAAIALGHREYLRGKYDLAVAAYTKAIEAWPRPVAYLLRAAAYERMGEAEKAEADQKAAESSS